MSLPCYPKYKDSGVEWLRQVPEHWEVVPGRRLFRQKRESAIVEDEQLSATQKYGVVPQRLFMELEDQKVTLALSGLENFKHVEAGDFVISLRSFQGGIEHSNYSGCVSPAYTVLRPAQTVQGVFWRYLLKSKGYIEALQSITDGIRDGKNISFDQFGEILVPFIPPAEQTVIAAFLDWETGKIDALVAEQRRLMELLKEKRQAVISQAVTRGLNPAVKLKPSGIEWLGDVPEHWAVKPLKSISTLYGRIGFRGYTTEDIVYEGEGAITLSPSNMFGGVVNTEKCTFISWGKYEESPEIQIAAGDVLIVKTGSTFGKVAFVDRVDYPMTINPQIAVFKNVSCVPKFLYLALTIPAIQSLVAVNNTGGTIPTMTQTTIGGFCIGSPPLVEQQAIVEHLEGELAKLDTLTAEAQRAIDLLQERRTALISAAVTGKIDVRNFNPN